MKTLGIIFIILSALNLFSAIATEGEAPYAVQGFVMLLVIGLFLISRANKKKQKELERNKWQKPE